MTSIKKARIKKACSLLKIFKKIKGDDCQYLLSHFSDESIEFLAEILYNCMYANFKMSSKKKRYLRKKLDPHRVNLKKLTKKSVPVARKRKLLQKGGGIILPLIASVVGPLIGDLLSKAFKK